MHGIVMGFDEEVSLEMGLQYLNVWVLILVGLKLRVAIAMAVLCVTEQSFWRNRGFFCFHDVLFGYAMRSLSFFNTPFGFFQL